MGVLKDNYKCTVHPQLKNCCAIDYIIHNLDDITETLLNLRKKFNQPIIEEKSH